MDKFIDIKDTKAQSFLENILKKLYVHQHSITIYTLYKFNDIPLFFSQSYSSV